MRLTNLIKNQKFWIIVFLAAFYLTRFPGIYGDSVNPDSVNWHFRSEQFVNGLKFLQLEKTYQHYQPGVTLMWVMGPAVELVKQFYPGHGIYTVETFPAFHFFARVVLIHVQLVLTILIFWLLKKFMDWKVALASIALFTFEPFFIGNSRELHMDVLLSLLLFAGVLISYWSLEKFDLKRSVLAGFFFGLSFLTKSVGIGSFLFAAGVGALRFWKKSPRDGLKYAAVVVLSSILTIFILLPALWVEPANVLTHMYDGIAEIGLEEGHGQVFFGRETRNPGPLFYPVVIALKSSPVFLFGIALYFVKMKKRLPKLTLESYLAIFYVGYLIVMTVGSKKLDRYMLPMYPFLSLLAVQGYFAFEKISKKILQVLIPIFLIWPMISLRPYYFTYTNPLFGSPKFVHENILAQKPFGLGVFELRDYIYENFGEEVNIGFIDPKPFFNLHDKDRLFYIRIEGTRRYEVLVLGVNEEMPGKVLESPFKFNYFGSIGINGLEYWKVYVREDFKKL